MGIILTHGNHYRTKEYLYDNDETNCIFIIILKHLYKMETQYDFESFWRFSGDWNVNATMNTACPAGHADAALAAFLAAVSGVPAPPGGGPKPNGERTGIKKAPNHGDLPSGNLT